MTTSDGGSDDTAAPVSVTVPDPAPAAAEPGFVVVARDQVEEYAGKGYQPGYAMLKPE